MINNKQKKLLVPVFFSTDVNYLPYLSVAIGSLIDHSSKNNTYNIYILTTDVTNKQITPIAENVPFWKKKLVEWGNVGFGDYLHECLISKEEFQRNTWNTALLRALLDNINVIKG